MRRITLGMFLVASNNSSNKSGLAVSMSSVCSLWACRISFLLGIFFQIHVLCWTLVVVIAVCSASCLFRYFHVLADDVLHYLFFRVRR